jgi:hypothetical protein
MSHCIAGRMSQPRRRVRRKFPTFIPPAKPGRLTRWSSRHSQSNLTQSQRRQELPRKDARVAVGSSSCSSPEQRQSDPQPHREPGAI